MSKFHKKIVIAKSIYHPFFLLTCLVFVLASYADSVQSQKAHEPTKGDSQAVISGSKEPAGTSDEKGTINIDIHKGKETGSSEPTKGVVSMPGKMKASPEVVAMEKAAGTLFSTVSKTVEELNAVKADVNVSGIEKQKQIILKKYNQISSLHEEIARMNVLKPKSATPEKAIWDQRYYSLINAMKTLVAEYKQSSGALSSLASNTQKDISKRKELPKNQMEKANEMLIKLMQANVEAQSKIAASIGK